MARKVWLEAALNGPWGRGRRPGIPITIDEVIADGVACAEAGAAVIHVHAYDVNTGRLNDDVETYRAIIAGIRARVEESLRTGKSFVWLASIGFIAVFREAFETVLFLQALVLDAQTSSAVVALGVLTATGLPPGAAGFFFIGRAKLDPCQPYEDGLRCAGAFTDRMKPIGFATADELGPDQTWTRATTNAVKNWQESRGMAKTGAVDRSQISFQPAAVRIAQNTVSVGSPAGGPIAKVTRPDADQPSSTLEAWVETMPSIPSGSSEGMRSSRTLTTPPIAVPP